MVTPHTIAYDPGPVVAEVRVNMRVARRKHHRRRAVAHAIGIERLCHPWRQRVRVDTHGIGAGGQVAEPVETLGIGRRIQRSRRGGHREGHLHARNAELGRILNPVAVFVVPHVVANRAEARESEVRAKVGLPRTQVDRVAVRGGCPVRGGKVGVGLIDRDDVGTRWKTREQVGATRVGRALGHELVTVVYQPVAVLVDVEPDGDTRDARLTGVVRAARIQVVEDQVTDAARVVVPEVGSQIGLDVLDLDHVLARIGIRVVRIEREHEPWREC